MRPNAGRIQEFAHLVHSIRATDQKVWQEELGHVVGEGRPVEPRCHQSRGQRHRNGRRRIPLVLASRMDIGVDLAAHHGHRLHTR